jgi:tetratricopeptide (TPR) repeat protein
MRPAVFAALLAVGGCAKHENKYQVPAATAPTDTASALKTAADALWSERGDKEKLKTALSTYEQAYAANPTDRDVAYKLTRGWYLLGDVHESETEPKLAAWDTSVTWGKRCLALNTEFTALLAKGDETEATAIRSATKDDVPCIYWTASALGKWAKLSGLAKTLKYLPTVKAYIARVQELDPTYYYDGPDRYWGAYYAAIPSFAGQDLDKSKQYFDKAIEAHPEYLGTKVLLAEYWATKKQDAGVFDATLKAVVEADPNAVPEIAPENKAEQKKAQDLMAKKSELFAQ